MTDLALRCWGRCNAMREPHEIRECRADHCPAKHDLDKAIAEERKRLWNQEAQQQYVYVDPYKAVP